MNKTIGHHDSPASSAIQFTLNYLPKPSLQRKIPEADNNIYHYKCNMW